MGFSLIPIGKNEGNFVHLEELLPEHTREWTEDAIICWLTTEHTLRHVLVQRLEKNAPWHLPRIFLHHSRLVAPLQYNRGSGSDGLYCYLIGRSAAGQKLGLVRLIEDKERDKANDTLQSDYRNRLTFPVLKQVPGCPRRNIQSTIPPPPPFSPQHVYSPFPNIWSV
jgi:hypothetical protein